MIQMNEFQKEIWINNYKSPDDNTIQDTFKRVSKAIAKAQKDPNMQKLLQENYFKLMSEWKFLPGGRITANAGVTQRNKATLYNCYVYNPQDFGIKDIDSMEVIFDTLKKSAKILASEGGLGINATYLRPNGSFIKGTGARTPGVVKFLQMWDKCSQIITMGSTKQIKDGKEAKKKIRKGAMMCFSENTLILTDKGWEPILNVIEKLNNGEQVKCKYVDGTYHTAKNPIVNQPSQIYIVQAEDGTKIECTADHRFQVYNIDTKETYLKAICDIDPEKQMVTIVKEK